MRRMRRLPAHVPLPPARLRFMGEDDERLVAQGVELAETLYVHGLARDQRLLDAGCGYGRLALGLVSTGFEGSYVGFDILERQVRWCSEHLTPFDGRYLFKHLDVRNDRYNPTGRGDPATTPFPVRSGSKDVAALFSVFTHMYEPEIRHYLSELRRVLVPGGLAVTSWLLFDRARLPAVVSSRSAYRLVHGLDEHVRFSDADDPLRAIGYRESYVRRIIRQAGLTVARVHRGSWCGEEAADGAFQDVVVITRPGRWESKGRTLTARLPWQ
jgi:SAM-dependent methyltransferase